jgi:hypothetical protein
VLPVCDAMSADDNRKQKVLLDDSVGELAKRGQRGYAIREALEEYRVGPFDIIPAATDFSVCRRSL